MIDFISVLGRRSTVTGQFAIYRPFSVLGVEVVLWWDPPLKQTLSCTLCTLQAAGKVSFMDLQHRWRPRHWAADRAATTTVLIYGKTNAATWYTHTSHTFSLDSRTPPMVQEMSSCISTSHYSSLRLKAWLYMIMTASSSWRSFCEMKSQFNLPFCPAATREYLWEYIVGQKETRRHIDMTKPLPLGGRYAGIGGCDVKYQSRRQEG